MANDRRDYEMSKMVRLMEHTGWVEKARKLDREKMTIVMTRNLVGLTAAKRRIEIDTLRLLVRAFGWEREALATDADVATVTLVKTLKPEVSE